MNKTNEEFPLSESVSRAISDMGFEELSPIQKQAIPLLLEGRDLIGQAQTGTGKTAAFGIPIVERTDPEEKCVQALVLCPTRELCIQVSEEISKLAKYKNGLFVTPVYGGQAIERQIKALRRGSQLVIGTPGRVLDHIKRKTLKLDRVKIFVLDEADEMFDMGFRDDIERVIREIPRERQTTFFSATMPQDIMDFAKKYQRDPEIVKVVNKEMTVPKVNQYYYDMQSHMKNEILTRVLDIYNPNLCIVFCNTKKMVDELRSNLLSKGYLADGLHGDLSQNQRDAVMGKFRSGSIDILVATDVAARGIDVDDVDLVINYDIPQDNEYYVHRIGRTARAGREGTAISFVTGRDYYRLSDIQKYTKTEIEQKKLPTLKDIESTRLDKLKDKIIDQIEQGDNSQAETLFNILLDSDYNPTDIAKAMMVIYQEDMNMTLHEELDYVDNDKVMPKKRKFSKKKGDKRKRTRKNMARIYINIGSYLGVSKRHILGAILEYTDLKKENVGNIDIYEKHSYADVPKSEAKKVIEGLSGKTIKGFDIKAEPAKPKR